MDDQKLCPCEFLIPVALNDGTLVPAATMGRILDALDRQFNGFQKVGLREGSWFGQVEECLVVLVAVPPNQVEALKTFVIAIGKELGQKKMYFDHRPPTVELLDSDSPGGGGES